MKTSRRLLSLCSGIRGIDVAWSHLLGQEIAGQVEIDPYCQAVLQKQWPDVVKRSDSREGLHDDPFGAVDVVAGGIPCRPVRVSGQRRGTDDDRHLWPAALALLERKRPIWVLLENGVCFISLALDLIGYDNAPGMVLYIDPPPYVLSTRARNSSPFEMTDEEHLQLLDTFNAHMGMVVPPGYAHPLYDERLRQRLTRPSVAQHGKQQTEVPWLHPLAFQRRQLSLFEEKGGVHHGTSA